MKTVLKFLYIAMAAVTAVIVYMYSYNTNGYNNIHDLTQEAIKAEKYEDVGKIHGGCFDTVNMISNNVNGVQMAVFPSVTLNEITYYTDDETTTSYVSFDKSYYIYAFNSGLTDLDTTSNGVVTNPAAIRLTSAKGSFDYYLKVSSTVNTSYYIEKPKTVGEAAVYAERNMFNYIVNYDFMCFTLTETMMKEISSSTACKGDITSFDIINTAGASIFHTDVNLDFSQKFFNDVSSLYDEYNKYITDYTAAKAANDTEAANAAKDRFDTFYEGTDTTPGFETTFLQGTTYTFRYSDSVLKPKSLVWKSVGITSLFVFCCALIYILLFYFSRVRDLLTNGRRVKTNPGVNRRDVINAKAKDVKMAPKATAPRRNPEPEVVEAEIVDPVIETKVADEAVVTETAAEETVVEAAPEASTETTEEK